MALEQYKNNQTTTLNGAITDVATSVTVTDGTVFPSVGDFRVLIESELMLCTSRATHVLTVTRGIESTANVAHDSAKSVDGILTAESLQQLVAIHHQTGTVAARPAAARDGLIYLPNDGHSIYRDTGSAWGPWGPMFPLTEPVDGDFSWVNQGGASVATTFGGIYLAAPASVTTDYRMRVQSAPSTPYVITAVLLTTFIRRRGSPASANSCGLVFRQSSDGKLANIIFYLDTALNQCVDVAKYTDENTFSAFYVGNNVVLTQGLMHLRIADNGTSRITSMSCDGQNFIALHTVGRTDFMTADQVGFFVNVNDASIGAGVTLIHWKET